MKRIFILSAVLLISPAWAVNKCVNSAGEVVYQAAPCGGADKSSEVAIRKGPIPSVQAPDEETEQLKAKVGDMERERRIGEISRQIASLENQVSAYRGAMSDELARLRYKKEYAANNLAGATWERSISEEMSAVSQKYDSLIRDNQATIDRLHKDQERLRAEDERVKRERADAEREKREQPKPDRQEAKAQ